MTSKASLLLSLVMVLTMLPAPFRGMTHVGASRGEGPASFGPDELGLGLLPGWAQLHWQRFAQAVKPAPEPPNGALGKLNPSGPLTPRVTFPIRHDVSPPMREIAPIVPARGIEVRETPFLPLPKAQRGSSAPAGGDPAVVQDWLGPRW